MLAGLKDDSRESCFSQHRSRVREISQILHDTGGLQLMQDVWGELHVRRASDKDDLTDVWAGIGDWQP